MTDDSAHPSAATLRLRLVPPPRPRVIDRPVLIERILATGCPSLLIEAPAGFGKTSLLIDAYHAAQGRPVERGWIGLEASDCERTGLARLLALAIAATDASAGSPFEEVIANQLARQRQPVLLFIDAPGDTVDVALPLLEALMPLARGQLRFVIASRRHPEVGLTRMRAGGYVEILGRSDLAFTADEAHRVLGDDVAPADLQLIMERTEGWPIMIQLVKQFLRRRELHWRSVAAFSGQTSELADYFSECVVGAVAPEQLEVLARVALCERFNGDLINHLCGRGDGWALIDMFLRAGLPIAPSDAAGRWHRLHRLFAEFLVGRLLRIGDQQIADLHRTAARWFAAHGDFSEAVRHAHAAGDVDLTTRALVDAGGWLSAFRGGTHVLRIIGELPNAVLEANPYLRLGQIYLLAQESRLREARQLFTRLIAGISAEAFASVGDRALFETNAGALDALLRVYEVRRVDPAELLALRAEGRPVPPVLAAMITHLLGFAYYSEGSFAEARRTLPAAADQCRAVGAEFVAGYSYLALGDTHLEMGEPERASQCFELAVDIARHSFGAESHQALAGRVFLADVAHERGELDRAATLIDSAIADIERRDPWFSVYIAAHRIAAATIRRRGSWRTAVEFLDEASARLERHDLLVAYAPYLALQKADILMRAGELDAATRLLELVPDVSGERPGRIEILRDISISRLSILTGHPSAALDRMHAAAPELTRRRHVRRLIKAHTLIAAAHLASGERRAAEINLDQAIALAQPGGLWNPICEEAELLSGLVAADLAERPACSIPRPPRARGTRAGISLGPRERQILLLLADGLSGKEMAKATDLAISTVLTYRKNLYRKLSVNSRSGAIAVGRRAGLI